MGVDDPSAHQRLRSIVSQARRVDRLTGDQWLTVVDPWTQGRGRAGEADRQRIADLPGGKDGPVLVPDLGHFGCPEVTDVAAGGRPCGLLSRGEDEAFRLPSLEIVGM